MQLTAAPTNLAASKPSTFVASSSAAPHRILYIDHTAAMGGGEIALLNLVRNMDRGRYTPVVLLCAGGPLERQLKEAGVETYVLPLADDVINTRKDSLGAASLLRLGSALRLISYVRRLAKFIHNQNV